MFVAQGNATLGLAPLDVGDIACREVQDTFGGAKSTVLGGEAFVTEFNGSALSLSKAGVKGYSLIG